MTEIFGSQLYSKSKSFDDTIRDLHKGFSELKIHVGKLNISEENKLIKRLLQFSTLNEYDKISLIDAYKFHSLQNNSNLALLTFNYHDVTIGNHGPRVTKNIYCELIGLTSLNYNIGHVLIKPETVIEKLIELINPVEVDFKENKEFSSNYYVLASDEKRLRENIDIQLLEHINKHKELYVEIINGMVLIRTLKPVDSDSIKTVVELIDDINKTTKR